MLSIEQIHDTKISWLLAGDPAIRYQLFRDLLNEDTHIVEAERTKILTHGWGKKLLDLQDSEGTWANGYYTPKWTSTFYTLLLLKRMGAPQHEKIIRACFLFLNKGFNDDGGINLWKSFNYSETCVTGMFLSILSHFDISDDRIHQLYEYLKKQQMVDAGWNCQSYKGDTHSSFHTTLSVLEGLREYQKRYQLEKEHDIHRLQEEGIEFLLQHKLFRSHRTGAIVDTKMLRFVFPPRWRYDIMRCLDYLQERNTPKDMRMQDAIDVLLKKKTKEGYWKAYRGHGGKTFFEMEKAGQVSRWNTLRALRIWQWWNTT